jgi:hypothetical protein
MFLRAHAVGRQMGELVPSGGDDVVFPTVKREGGSGTMVCVAANPSGDLSVVAYMGSESRTLGPPC